VQRWFAERLSLAAQDLVKGQGVASQFLASNQPRFAGIHGGLYQDRAFNRHPPDERPDPPILSSIVQEWGREM
jgi:hypothetical protein